MLSWTLLFGVVLCWACSPVVTSIAAERVASYNIHVGWDYEPPPDLKQYEIKCTPDDADIKVIPLAEVSSLDDHGKDIPSWQWAGTVKMSAGKATCYLRAVDLANQASPWSDPAEIDAKPPKILQWHITKINELTFIKHDNDVVIRVNGQ